MLFILRAVLLWISIFGFCAYLKKYMNPAFTPVFTMSSIGVLLFVAGLLNIMSASVYLIVLGGWICLLLCKPWKKAFFVDNKSTFVIFGVFSALCGLFLIRVYNQIPTHYDCFSHWLTVVRDMIHTNSMPNFNSSLISFQGYPTGSAGFIYFISKALGNSRDDLLLFAQTILYAAAITSFGAFIKRFDVFQILIAVVGSVLCVCAMPYALDHLLVDTLISLISVAVVACLIYYRKEIKIGVLISLPLQLFLVAVKNSGIAMVAINFVLVAALSIAFDYAAKRKFSVAAANLVKYGSLTAGIPAVLYYLWLQHVEYVFTAGTLSKHTVSLDNYKQTLGDKTAEQVKEILSVFIKRFISWNPAWKLLIVVVVLIFLGWLVKKYVLKQPAKAEVFIFLGVIGAYLAFMAILAAMYLLSMPYSEAAHLASYDRYEKTILIYIVGIVTIYILSLGNLFPNFKKGFVVNLVLLLTLSSALTLQTTGIKALFTQTNSYVDSSRAFFDEIKQTYAIPEGKSYFVYSNRHQTDGGYHYYLTRYIFWSNRVSLCAPEDFEKRKESIENYDYIIVADYDEQIVDFLSGCNIEPGEHVYVTKGVLE